MKTFNTPVAAWHRGFYSTRTGTPTISALKKGIDEGKIPGGQVLGKYHVTTDARGNLAYDTLNKVQQPPRVTSPVALAILEEIGQ